MRLREESTHSFIIKLWLEETAEESGQALWRGHITHILSGKRQYVQDLHDIDAFIARYLCELGVLFGLRWWLRHCLKLWKVCVSTKQAKREH